MNRRSLVTACFATSAVLTTITWLFFRYSAVSSRYPLHAGGTTVVFTFWLILTAAALSVWPHHRKK
jgi:hypothetical protein